MKVTVFKTLTDTSSPIQVDVLKVLEQIRTGGDKKALLESIRELDGSEYKEAKKKLPIICFGGSFGNRSKDGIIDGSGLLILDADDGTEEQLNELRTQLESELYTFATFSSPRLRGRFKAIIRIPVTASDEEYKKYFAALKKKYKTIDPSGKDISRACFFTYDPHIFINKNATIWSEQYETPKQKKETRRYDVRNWDAVNGALKQIEFAEDGFKHLARTKIGFLFGGWIKAKEINYSDAINLLEDAVRKNTTDLKSAMKTIEQCVQAGMEKPLNMYEQKEVLKMEFSSKRRYKPMSEVWDKVYDFYKTGYKRGWDVGFECAKEFVSILAGATSYWYGKPRDGKSQIWHEFLINMTEASVGNGEPFYNAILTPETGEIEHIYGEFISIYAKQTFVGDFKMPEEDMIKFADFVSKYFLVLDYEGDSATMKDIMVQVEAAEREFGIKFNTVTIDPMNYIDFDEGRYSRRDLVIAKDLDFLLADARKNNRHNAIITHAKNQPILTNKNNQRYFDVVSPREILDGEQYFRKGMLMGSIYRPLDMKGVPLPNEDGIPCEENQTDVWIHKSKPKGIGRNGKFTLYYDWKANRYYEKDEHGIEYYAWGVPRNDAAKTTIPPKTGEVLEEKPDSERDISSSERSHNLLDVFEKEGSEDAPF